MKATLMFATLSMVFALPEMSAKTEIEVLRTRCTEQDEKIRSLEGQIQQLRGSKAGAGASSIKTAAVAGEAKEKAGATDGIYVVQAGDSVERIARRNACSVSNLNKINDLKSSSTIHPGQRLKLPGTATAKVGAVNTTTSESKPAPVSLAVGKTHKIKQGETYGSIAKKYRVSVDSLISANPGIKATALRPGQEIRLSASSPTASSSPAAKPTSAIAGNSTTPPKSAPKPSSEPAIRPEPAIKAPGTNSTPSPQAPRDLASNLPVSTLSTNSASYPLNSAAIVPPKPAAASENSAPALEKKIRSVKIEGPMTYGQFAAQYGTDPSRLNDLNGLDLTQATVLAKGSELYVPAQP